VGGDRCRRAHEPEAGGESVANKDVGDERRSGKDAIKLRGVRTALRLSKEIEGGGGGKTSDRAAGKRIS